MFSEELARLKALGRDRHITALSTAQKPEIMLDGKSVLLFCSNNYLGFADDERLKQAAKKAIDEFGTGAGASRLLSGAHSYHDRLEKKLAGFMDRPAALLFGSGYQANVGIIPALVGEGDLILSDELNHASLIDGCRLSRAKVIVYPHRDLGRLKSVLQQEGKGFRRRLVVSESVFSMEGSLADVRGLWEIATTNDALLFIDDAHAVGVLGPQGQGSAHHFKLEHDIQTDSRFITIGTLGKSLGSFGAFVACTKEVRDYLVNKARPFIFSTALPASVCAAAEAAIDILQHDPSPLLNLRRRCAEFASGLAALEQKTTPDAAIIPIQPVWAGTEEKALGLAEKLLQQGVYARAIRPPTVPEGQCRIRFSLMATHHTEHVKTALAVLRKIL